MVEEKLCAVCAEAVKYVAYGECGHTDVCVTCIARLRFVCGDLHCCICQSLSPSVFVTPALGPHTRVINDFSALPAHTKDGEVGVYWFHKGIQAYFDDFDVYKIVKDMCKLSCTMCEKSQAEGVQNSKRENKIKNVEQLKNHLSRQHELFFCSLCLANKKVFISDQKLYSQVHLKQHIRNGDSEVDGFGPERCGFSGHPFCEFCETPFYDDNELFFHMSTEHFTCHICKRQHSTEYEYYSDYNDLEIHFRQAHFLCDHIECLDKKFIVFDTEADFQTHAALEHGTNISLSKCNVVLQERAEEGYRVHTRISSTTSSDAEGNSSNFLDDASTVQSNAMEFRGVLLNGRNFPPLPSTSNRRRRKSKKNSQQTGQNTADPNATSSSSPNTSNQLNLISSGVHSLSINHYGSSSSLPTCDFVDGGSLSLSTCGESSLKGDEDVRAANKSLIDRLRAALNFDQEKFSAFKRISRVYRDGEIDAEDYLSYVQQFDLEHFIPDLARLCPDQHKQQELLENYNSWLDNTKKGKEKCEDSETSRRDTSQDAVLNKESLKVSSKPGKQLSSSNTGKKNGIKKTKKGKEKSENSETSKRITSPDGLVMKESKVHSNPDKEPSSSKGKSSVPTDTKDVVNTSAVIEIPETLPSKPQSKSSTFSAVIEINARDYLSYVHQFDLDHFIPDLARLCTDQHKQKELIENYNSWLDNTMKGKEKCEDTSRDVVVNKESQVSSKLGKESLSSNTGKKKGIKKTKKGKEKSEISETSKRNTSSDGLSMKESKVHSNPDKESSSSKGKSSVPTVSNTSSVIEIPDIRSEFSAISLAYSQPQDIARLVISKSNYDQSTTTTRRKKQVKKSSKILKTDRMKESSSLLAPNLMINEVPSDLMVVRPTHDSILASVRGGIWRNDCGRRLVPLTEASPCSR